MSISVPNNTRFCVNLTFNAVSHFSFSIVSSEVQKRLIQAHFQNICSMLSFSSLQKPQWVLAVKVRYLLFNFYTTGHEKTSLFRRCIIYPVGEIWRSSSIRLTSLDSICNTESSDLVDNLSGVAYTNSVVAKKKNCPDGALDRNTAQLSIGTAMYSGSEHRKTGRVFSYPSNATSKYS